MNSAGVKTTKGIAWSFLERLGSQGTNLIISTILARKILPEAYSVAAAASLFISIATTFVATGFGSALVQKKDADDTDYSSMFIFNAFFSLSIYFAVYFSAPYLVMFLNKSYDYKLLVKVIRIIGIGIVFASFNTFYRSILIKQFNFKKIFFITSAGSVISGIVGIIMAYSNFGVWALVAQNIISFSLNTLLFALFSEWRFKPLFSFDRLKPMLLYGGRITLASLISTVYGHTSDMVVANRFEDDELSYYNRGRNYPKMIVVNLMAAINNALFPLLVTLKTTEEHKNCVRNSNKYSTFVIMPIMFGFAAVSGTFVRLILTDVWLPCVAILQLNCLNYALQPIGIANLQYWKAIGRTKLYLAADTARNIIGIVSILLAVVFGNSVLHIVIAEAAATVIGLIIILLPGKKLLNYSIFRQISDILPTFLLSGAMFAAVYSVELQLNINLTLKLFLEIFLGIAIYAGGALLFRMKEFYVIKDMLITRIKHKNTAA